MNLQGGKARHGQHDILHRLFVSFRTGNTGSISLEEQQAYGILSAAKFSPLCVRLSPQAFCKSLLEHSDCFVRPWRLNNRQLSRLIRLRGLYCHQGWADKWSALGCRCRSGVALKGIIIDVLISIQPAGRWTTTRNKHTHTQAHTHKHTCLQDLCLCLVWIQELLESTVHSLNPSAVQNFWLKQIYNKDGTLSLFGTSSYSNSCLCDPVQLVTQTLFFFVFNFHSLTVWACLDSLSPKMTAPYTVRQFVVHRQTEI